MTMYDEDEAPPIGGWDTYDPNMLLEPYNYLRCWRIGCVYQTDQGFRIRKWGIGGDPLDPEVYDTLEAAKLAVEIKYGGTR